MVDTLKTAVVVVLLLAVLYGVYVVLNKPEQYSQELAWETEAADPALQIELGMPETGEAITSPTSAPPTSSWDSTPATFDEPSVSHSNHTHEDSSSTYEVANQTSLNGQPSLPIPEPTMPAAPAIAAPNLIDSSDSTASNSDDATATGVSYTNDGTLNTSEVPSPTLMSSDLAGSTSTSDGAASTDRYASSNRYADNSPLRDSPASKSTTDRNTQNLAPVDSYVQPPATSTQANVNDIAEPKSAAIGFPLTDNLDGGGTDFRSAMQSARVKIGAEAWTDALVKLSPYYNDPALSADEFSQLVDLLDPLAGKVIYSMEHLIEPAYQPQAGDTLENIANRFDVPWQLLANINGIENPEALLGGRELKVVRGPFRAEISLSKNELTLFADKLYAGRFPITIGSNPAPLPGQYQVNDKQPGRTYYAGNGQTIPIDDPSNPYGRVWIDLGSNLSIHGSSPNGSSPGQGCIALTARDAGDVFGILSKGSSIVIQR